MSALVVGDSVVHYEFFGRGKPLVFVHGWLGSWRYWVNTMDALSESNRVYALDLWGFGDSDKTHERYSVEGYVALLRAFIRDLGVKVPIPMVGHALGAAVILSYALEHSEAVERVMTVGLPMTKESINQRWLTGSKTFLDRMLGRTATAGYEDVEREAARTADGAVAQSVASVIEADVGSRLSELTMPHLAVYGAQDSVVTPPQPSTVEGAGGQSRVLIMPECKHFPMLDRSSQFNRLLVDFLQVEGDLDDLDLKIEWTRRIR